MSGSSQRKGGLYTVAEPRQIAALAVPVRQAIVDAVAGGGPCSIATLAAQLGRPASGLYHHVRALARVGLLVAGDATPGAAGRPAVLYDVPGRSLRIRYAPDVRATRAPMQRVVGAMTRLASREFNAGYREGVRVDGPRRDLWASRAEAWLTDAQIERANALLEEMLTLFTPSGLPRARGARLRSLVFVLAPGRDG